MQDLHSVGICVELGNTVFRAVPVLDHHIFNRKVLIDRVNAHLCLDLKSPGQDRKRLHKLKTEGAVTGHNVLNAALKQEVDALPHQKISEVVKRALVLFKIGGGKPVADHHITLPLQHRFNHFRCAVSRIGVIPVDHQIALRVDLAEHSPDDISLSLPVFMANRRPGLRCKFGGPVGGIVVIDIDPAVLRQNRQEVPYNLFDGQRFVVARDQYRYFIHCFPLMLSAVYPL